MTSVLAVMCERCAGDECNGIPHNVFLYATSAGFSFWGCDHLALVNKDVVINVEQKK